MKIAFSGTHGTGKTTSVFKEAIKYKIDNPGCTVGIMQEMTQGCPYSINSPDEKAQLWIFSNQLKSELTMSSLYDCLICDRTLIDNIAYSMYFELGVGIDCFAMIKSYMKSYDKIYFKLSKNNPYHHDDGFRGDGGEYRDGVEEKIKYLYTSLINNNFLSRDVIEYR